MNQTLIVPYSHYLGWNANKERDMQLILATGVNENFGQIRNNRGLVHLSMAEICS
jgi:hypothetical protein